jgi:hypothetical protein
VTRIGILEDNARRLAEMLAALHDTFPQAVPATNPDAHAFIAWLSTNILTLDLLCLDHDLEAPIDNPKHDPGDGRDVVRWLLSQPVRIPVLIHTTNGRAGAEMESLLKDAGWRAYWTPPHDDLVWIRKTWIKRVGEMLSSVRD